VLRRTARLELPLATFALIQLHAQHGVRWYKTMYRKAFLAVGLALAMMGMQACFYSGPSRDWSGRGYQDNDPQYGRNEGSRTLCDSNGNHCAVCDADSDNCQRTTTARSSWFIW
jgi:hypothetical protein